VLVVEVGAERADAVGREHHAHVRARDPAAREQALALRLEPAPQVPLQTLTGTEVKPRTLLEWT
jgi:hypothetical protein